jgi:hypothetical protein
MDAAMHDSTRWITMKSTILVTRANILDTWLAATLARLLGTRYQHQTFYLVRTVLYQIPR